MTCSVHYTPFLFHRLYEFLNISIHHLLIITTRLSFCLVRRVIETTVFLVVLYPPLTYFSGFKAMPQLYFCALLIQHFSIKNSSLTIPYCSIMSSFYRTLKLNCNQLWNPLSNWSQKRRLQLVAVQTIMKLPKFFQYKRFWICLINETEILFYCLKWKSDWDVYYTL